MLLFLTGFFSCYALNSVYIGTESPYFVGLANSNSQPGDWVSEKNIEVLSDKVIIHVKDAVLSRYANTGSMLPTLGENSNGIKIVPESDEQIKIGDIISFEKNGLMIVHRVVAKGEDEKGKYFITKGDNNSEIDGKVYFPDVKYVTIALIY